MKRQFSKLDSSIRLEFEVIKSIYFHGSDAFEVEDKSLGTFKTLDDVYKYIYNHEKKWEREFKKIDEKAELEVVVVVYGYDHDNYDKEEAYTIDFIKMLYMEK